MREKTLKILLTGATGKVGLNFIKAFFASNLPGTIRALCHNRTIEESERLEVFRGSITDNEVVRNAMKGITHVVHLSTTKEDSNTVIDVSIKGLFWLLEESRVSSTFHQFIMVGGDAAVGHFFYDHQHPITELTPRRPYPGCYAMSKALEEDMLEYYFQQYNLNGCCLRAPWIMEKDDFKYALTFGDLQFGGPLWKELVGAKKAEQYAKGTYVPLMLDAQGNPLKRNFIHVDDLVGSIISALNNQKAKCQLFNIAMESAVDYGKAALFISDRYGLEPIKIATGFHSVKLDISKAKLLLNWRPKYDITRLIEEAFNYVRAPDDPRKIWYPG